MIRVGLTGGMGAGKSTVAKTFEARGAYLVDADKVAREVVEPGSPGLAALVEAFGSDILAADGSLNRPALAAKAFVDDAQRAKLNAITHPLVGARTMELLDAAPSNSIVVQDIPLLVENHTAPFFHAVIVVDADEEVRVHRLTTSRGLDEADARARIRAQATPTQRRAVADAWLDNSGTPDDLARAAAQLWDERLAVFADNVTNGVAVADELSLVAADPAWPEQGTKIVNRLFAVLGADAAAIDHIGATSVPGLEAPPIIEVQVTVNETTDRDALTETLTNGGFPPIDAASSLFGSADPGRPARVHVRRTGTAAARFAVDLRDWLRADESARAEFAAVQRGAIDGADGDWRRFDAVLTAWFDLAAPRILAWRSTGD